MISCCQIIILIGRYRVPISKYGLKIKNIEASTLFEYNIGVRDHYEYKDAMFTNSLFSDFLKENGLNVWNDESTRDIICLEFNYGSRSYNQEVEHLQKIAKNAKKEYRKAKLINDKFLLERSFNKKAKIKSLSEEAHRNKSSYSSMTKEEIRRLFYNEGVDVEYISRTREGKIKKQETIHYKMLFRSTGKAKKGSCMFIRDELYDKAKDFLYMGIQLDDENPKIVEISAYAPLVSSGIVGKIKINPKNILILKDVDRYFKTNVVSIETDEEKHCVAKRIDGYELKNTLFDGQALIDSSIFPSWGNGYILLRHHFCKMAAFSTNIQLFFKEYFGGLYQIATVTDMFGNEHYVRDIELITTDNAMKWIKLGKSYEYWCQKVYDNNCMFGIVKTAHESKLGNSQKMSYQMVNSLDEEIMGSVVERSVKYVEQLKTDTPMFLDYLKKNSNFSNDFDVLVALCKQNPDFVDSTYFRSRKKKIIETYVLGLKSGELLQNAENLVIVGSPYAMLLYGATGKEEDVDKDDTFYQEEGTIQCYTERFDSDEYLAFFRSPFNSKNNLTYLHNVYCKNFEKYFNLGRQVIAVNMIGTDFQDKNNGSDQDSDFGYTTNQPDIVEHARKCYLNYPTIVNNIPKDTNIYHNTMDDYATIDNGLAKSQIDIGQSSNLAQLAQTYACNFDDKKYDDYTCTLSVLAQCSIDSAKRRFDIDISDEIDRIKKDMDIKTNKYPSFWLVIKKGFNKKNINKSLHCPMNYLYDLELARFKSAKPSIPMSDFFVKHELSSNRKKCKKVEELISSYSIQIREGRDYENKTTFSDTYLLFRSNFDDLVKSIRSLYISNNYVGLMSWLIDRAFIITPDIKRNSKTMKNTMRKNKSLLLKVLYEVNKDALLSCFTHKS